MSGRSTTRKRHHRNVANVRNYLNRIKTKYEEQHKINSLWNNASKNATLKTLLEPDEKLFNDLTTIKNVNKIIGRIYDLDGTTNPLRKLKGFGEAVADWDVMDSSTNNNDCLIHSVLTATCENFRKLKKEDKDEFANFFRRKIFLTLPVVLCYQETEEPEIFNNLYERVHSTRFLEDIELFLLAAQFKFRILGAGAYEGYNQFQYIDARGIRGTIPENCCEEDDNEWPIICLYTNDSHFESVRVGGHDYDLTEAQVATALESLEATRNTWDCGRCTLKNPVRTMECAACASQKPHTSSAAPAEAPKKFKVVKPAPESTTTVKKFVVKKKPASGGRRQTRRLRRQHSV